jgi:hypothetical protein
MTEPEPTADTELLLAIMAKGVVESGVWPEGTRGRLIPALVAEGALAEDHGFVYLTDTGDEQLSRSLRARVTPEDHDALAAFADEFTGLDAEVKTALTAWQRARQDNDPDGQVAAIESWLNADQRLTEAADRSEAARRLFGRYLDRLQRARQDVLAGQPDRLSGADDSSYHNLWFLLHEVLLRSLGRKRRE